MMLRVTLALNLAMLPAAAGCAPEPKPLPSFRCQRDDVPGSLRAHLREGRIYWLDSQGVEHPISGTPEEPRWSCLPADGRAYPIDPT